MAERVSDLTNCEEYELFAPVRICFPARAQKRALGVWLLYICSLCQYMPHSWQRQGALLFWVCIMAACRRELTSSNGATRIADGYDHIISQDEELTFSSSEEGLNENNKATRRLKSAPESSPTRDFEAGGGDETKNATTCEMTR